jgi:predicted nucleic acid-binding protein
MRAVSDTSPLSNLASIGRLHLLRAQFTEVVIPQALVRELSAHPDPQGLTLIQTAMREQWIKPTGVSDSPILKLLLLQLHQGEAEAVSLASEMQADMVLIERAGRPATRQPSVPFRYGRTEEESSMHG